jgi:hypothetical protein
VSPHRHRDALTQIANHRASLAVLQVAQRFEQRPRCFSGGHADHHKVVHQRHDDPLGILLIAAVLPCQHVHRLVIGHDHGSGPFSPSRRRFNNFAVGDCALTVGQRHVGILAFACVRGRLFKWAVQVSCSCRSLHGAAGGAACIGCGGRSLYVIDQGPSVHDPRRCGDPTTTIARCAPRLPRVGSGLPLAPVRLTVGKPEDFGRLLGCGLRFGLLIRVVDELVAVHAAATIVPLVLSQDDHIAVLNQAPDLFLDHLSSDPARLGHLGLRRVAYAFSVHMGRELAQRAQLTTA